MRYAALFWLFLGSSVETAHGQEPSALERAWDSVVSRLPTDARRAAQVMNQAFGVRGVPLLYWPKKGIPDSALNDLEVFDGPCGGVVFTQSTTIPPPDARLVGEAVAEIDSTGRVLRRWPVPSNSSPFALRADQLLIHLVVDDRHDLALAIGTDGRYVVVPIEGKDETQYADCPPDGLFRSSAYGKCLWLPDPGRGRRLVAYQAPCT